MPAPGWLRIAKHGEPLRLALDVDTWNRVVKILRDLRVAGGHIDKPPLGPWTIYVDQTGGSQAPQGATATVRVVDDLRVTGPGSETEPGALEIHVAELVFEAGVLRSAGGGAWETVCDIYPETV